MQSVPFDQFYKQSFDEMSEAERYEWLEEEKGNLKELFSEKESLNEQINQITDLIADLELRLEK